MDIEPKWPIIYGIDLNFNQHSIDEHWLGPIERNEKSINEISKENYLPIEAVVHAVSCRFFDLGEINKANKVLKEYLAENDDPTLHNSYLRCLLGSPNTTKEVFRKETIAWNELYTKDITPLQDKEFANIDLSQDRKLNVGVLCGYAQSTLFELVFGPSFKALNREEFNIILFNVGSIEHESVQQYFDVCIDIPVYSVERLTVAIENNNVDILIDLNGRFRLDNPIEVLLKRLVPIQISYANMLASYSLEAIQYIFTDKYTLLEEDEKYYSEKIYRFKNNVMGGFELPNSEVSSLPSLSLDGKKEPFTFGSFNALFKLNDDVLEAWCEILTRVPNSRLIIKSIGVESPRLQKRLIDFVVKYKLDDRIILESFTPMDEMLKRYNVIDLALNPFPYSGGTTTVFALWNGVPSMTLYQDGMVQSGGGEGVLQEVGLDQFVAKDVRQYIDKAIYFAKNPKKLQSIRMGMRKRLKKSVRFNPKAFAKDFGEGLRFTWRDWLKNADF